MAFNHDPRTIVLGDDGRYVTLGRYSSPSDDEVAQAGAGLAQQGMGGWLARMEGNPCAKRAPRLTILREIAAPRASWESACAAFETARKAKLQGMK